MELEKYTNWTEKSIRGVQQQTQTANLDRSLGIMESKDKENEKSKQSLRDMWDIIKLISWGIMGVPERKGQRD